MKPSAIFLFGLLLCSMVLSEPAQGPASCSTSNKFLAGLRAQKVKIFDSPFFGSSKCGSEWSQFGTCCEESSLAAYVRKDSQHLTNFYDMMLRELKLAHQGMTQFEADLQALQAPTTGPRSLRKTRQASAESTNEAIEDFFQSLEIVEEPIEDLSEDLESPPVAKSRSGSKAKTYSTQGRKTGSDSAAEVTPFAEFVKAPASGTKDPAANPASSPQITIVQDRKKLQQGEKAAEQNGSVAHSVKDDSSKHEISVPADPSHPSDHPQSKPIISNPVVEHPSHMAHHSSVEPSPVDHTPIDHTHSDPHPQASGLPSNSNSQSPKNPTVESHQGLSAALKKQLPQLAAETAAIAGNFAQVEQSFAKKYESCAEEMVKLRSAAVCTVCSGRGSAALDNGRLKISEETCTEFIQTCFDSWTMLIQIMNGMKRGKEIAEKIQASNPSFSFPYRGQFVDAMGTWLRGTNLEQNLGQCRGGAHGCPTATKSSICGAVLNVEQATFVEDNLELILKGRKSATADELRGFDSIKTVFRVENNPPAPTIQPPQSDSPAGPLPSTPSTPLEPSVPSTPQTTPNNHNKEVIPEPNKLIQPIAQPTPGSNTGRNPKPASNPQVNNPYVSIPPKTGPIRTAGPSQPATVHSSPTGSPASFGYLIYNKAGVIIGFRGRAGVYHSVSR